MLPTVDEEKPEAAADVHDSKHPSRPLLRHTIPLWCSAGVGLPDPPRWDHSDGFLFQNLSGKCLHPPTDFLKQPKEFRFILNLYKMENCTEFLGRKCEEVSFNSMFKLVVFVHDVRNFLNLIKPVCVE